MCPTSDRVGDHRQKWSWPRPDRTAATAGVRALRPPNVTMVNRYDYKVTELRGSGLAAQGHADVEHARAALARDAGVSVDGEAGEAGAGR